VRFSTLALALAVATALAPPLLAAPAPGDIADLTEPVSGASGKTALDLLRQLFADIEARTDSRRIGSATQMIDLRSIGAADDSWIGCRDRIDIEYAHAHPLQLAGQRLIVVVVALADECAAPLAMFDGDGRLVDAVNLRGDQHLSFSGDYIRPLGSAGALVIGHNWHDNSNQSYDLDSLILAKPSGFSVIGDVFAFGSRDCQGQFTEDAKISTIPAKPMARIEIAIKREARKFATDCATRIGRKVATTFNGSWRWNARKGAYEPQTRELDLLADWNQKHF
jgi:hypothetical protein